MAVGVTGLSIDGGIRIGWFTESQTQDQFRFYADDGGEAASTPLADQNENISQAASIAAIIRIQVNNSGDFPAQQMKVLVKQTPDPDSNYREVPVAS